MKKRLTERYVIDLMREEWEKKLHSFVEKSKMSDTKTSKKVPPKGEKDLEINFDVNKDGHKEMVISPGLNVTNKSDPFPGLKYQVVDVDSKTVKLSRAGGNGEKKIITITREDFEKNYSI